MENLQVRRVAILGFGTVGKGVYKVIRKQQEEFPYIIGAELEIAKILVRNKAKYSQEVEETILTDNWAEIIADDSIDIIIEVMGGIEPARTYILEALRAGKHVVTANKDLVAQHGHELLDTASQNNCDLLFEASVAGGIPIIRPLKQCLAANTITEVIGIINGTTNFILTKMSQEGMEFQDALALATELGYAEADPTADIEGYDAGRKIAIMASIAFHSRVTFSDVYTEGISKITAKDIRYAHEMDYEIKLLGIACNTPEGVEVRVHPTFIPKSHPLAAVSDSFNAVFVHGDALDDAMFYGRGAGELPTASAVVGDVIDIARNMQNICTGRIGCTCYKSLPIKPMAEVKSSYYLRMQLEDKPGTLSALAGVFGENKVSIFKLVQKTRDNDTAEVVIITAPVKEKRIQEAIKTFSQMEIIRKISSFMRVYD